MAEAHGEGVRHPLGYGYCSLDIVPPFFAIYGQMRGWRVPILVMANLHAPPLRQSKGFGPVMTCQYLVEQNTRRSHPRNKYIKYCSIKSKVKYTVPKKMDYQQMHAFFTEEHQRLDRLKEMVQSCPVSRVVDPSSSSGGIVETFTVTARRPNEPISGQYVRIQRVRPAPSHNTACKYS